MISKLSLIALFILGISGISALSIGLLNQTAVAQTDQDDQIGEAQRIEEAQRSDESQRSPSDLNPSDLATPKIMKPR